MYNVITIIWTSECSTHTYVACDAVPISFLTTGRLQTIKKRERGQCFYVVLVFLSYSIICKKNIGDDNL